MKLLTLAVLAASLAMPPSMAFAKSSTGTASDAATTDPGTFWSGDWMRDFYSDDGMTKMKSSAEAQAAFAKMTPENQAKLKSEC